MLNKKIKNIQKNMTLSAPNKPEYQTVRLFAILGVLTLVFVLVIKLVRIGPQATPQRQPTTSILNLESNR